MMRGSWITFDCYGTLIDWNTGIRKGLRAAAPGASDGQVAAMAAEYEALEQELERDTYRPYPAIQKAVTLALLTRHGFPPPANPRILTETLPQWGPFAEVPAVLRRLKAAGYRLGILSNIDRGLMGSSLEKLPVTFDIVITAEDVESYKPAPAHWTRFLRATGAKPEEVFHVAQGLIYDIGTASELGFRTVWINRRGEAPGSIRADYTTDSLEGVLRVIPA